MSFDKKIQKALISVFHKDGLDPIIKKLNDLGVEIYSTGGTQNFIESLNVDVTAVESLTSYPSILGGRVKTLHPKVFGGILARQDYDSDIAQVNEYEIPLFDLVIVDLYPFEDTVASGASEAEIIEKIDIGGISLIRAAAKNFKDLVIISSRDQYGEFLNILEQSNGSTTLEERKEFATKAFGISSFYDRAINSYFAGANADFNFSNSEKSKTLRYGENPHQKGTFHGNLEDLFDQIHGKELSYNNLLDVDAAVALMADFDDSLATFAILKHNNACGLARRSNLKDTYTDALAGDPISAFGGILISNKKIDAATAEKMHELFFEISIAPDYDSDALEILKQKKNRIILKQKPLEFSKTQFRSLLNGVLEQDKDLAVDKAENFKLVTEKNVDNNQTTDLEFASILVKHTKSNAIVLAKGNQLLASGTGQTSRVDALNQAIDKAKKFNFDLEGAVMASDAFFPFPDCVEIAGKAGITAVIQPGGSIKDQDSIDACNERNMAMVLTRHKTLQTLGLT